MKELITLFAIATPIYGLVIILITLIMELDYRKRKERFINTFKDQKEECDKFLKQKHLYEDAYRELCRQLQEQKPPVDEFYVQQGSLV